MTKNGLAFSRRASERGQTIILVAVSMVALLGMAALAIDVVTLYVARSEMQRAADAAALAGAKAFVDSGVTSDPTNPNRQLLAQSMIPSLVNAVLPQNKVSGAVPVLVGAPIVAFGAPGTGNPHVTVTVQKTDLPTFFARIWGSRLATVTASAVAEAYNPSGAPSGYPPIAPKAVKPLLVVNQDPQSAIPFKLFDPATGVVANAIGERATLKPCPGGACAAITGALQFRPAQVAPGTSNRCPSTCTPPGSDYESSIECYDSATPPATQYQCGSPALTPLVDPGLIDPALSNGTNNGLQCLTNQPSEDTLDPTDLAAGTGPAKITAGSGPQAGNLVTTSRSIATFPIIDPPGPGPTRVVGFLQVFVDPVTTTPVPTPAVPTSTPFRITILNVVGCADSPGAGPAVLGGGYSPVPVRLIQ